MVSLGALRTMVAAAVFLTFAQESVASNYNATVTTGITTASDGMHVYSYAVANSRASSENVRAFGLTELPEGLGEDIVTSPDGWIMEVSSTSVLWSSSEPKFDITPGRTLSGFAIQSPLAPGKVTAKLVAGDIAGADEMSVSVKGPAGDPTRLPPRKDGSWSMNPPIEWEKPSPETNSK